MPVIPVVITPVEPITAILVLLLLQVPYVESASLSVIDEKTQTLESAGPMIVGGSGLTNTVSVILHPVILSVYVIWATPPPTPVTTPDSNPMVATDTKLLLHVPGILASLKVIESPTHTGTEPTMESGKGLTLNVYL